MTAEMNLIVVVLIAISIGLGNSALLFINRLSYFKMILVFSLSVFLEVLSVTLNIFLLWQVTRLFFTPFSLEQSVSIVVIAYLPLMFSFLKLIPAVGILITRMLALASLLIYIYLVFQNISSDFISVFLSLGVIYLLTLFLRELLTPLEKVLENSNLILDKQLALLALKMDLEDDTEFYLKHS